MDDMTVSCSVFLGLGIFLMAELDFAFGTNISFGADISDNGGNL